jgi:hypothetical protein
MYVLRKKMNKERSLSGKILAYLLNSSLESELKSILEAKRLKLILGITSFFTKKVTIEENSLLEKFGVPNDSTN